MSLPFPSQSLKKVTEDDRWISESRPLDSDRQSPKREGQTRHQYSRKEETANECSAEDPGAVVAVFCYIHDYLTGPSVIESKHSGKLEIISKHVAVYFDWMVINCRAFLAVVDGNTAKLAKGVTGATGSATKTLQQGFPTCYRSMTEFIKRKTAGNWEINAEIRSPSVVIYYMDRLYSMLSDYVTTFKSQIQVSLEEISRLPMLLKGLWEKQFKQTLSTDLLAGQVIVESKRSVRISAGAWRDVLDKMSEGVQVWSDWLWVNCSAFLGGVEGCAEKLSKCMIWVYKYAGSALQQGLPASFISVTNFINQPQVTSEEIKAGISSSSIIDESFSVLGDCVTTLKSLLHTGLEDIYSLSMTLERQWGIRVKVTSSADFIAGFLVGLIVSTILPILAKINITGKAKTAPQAADPSPVTGVTLSAIDDNYVELEILEISTNFRCLRVFSKASKETPFMKCLRVNATNGAKLRLEREYKALRKIPHVNIVRAMDWIKAGTSFAMVLEFARHGNLLEAMPDPLAVPLRDKLAVFRQLVKAVAHMHTSHIAHLNIRPETVLVFAKWSLVKLSAFSRCEDVPRKGLCDVYDLDPNSAPESVSFNKEPYNPFKVDSWAMGRLLQYLLIGPDFYKKAATAHITGCSPKLEKPLMGLVTDLMSVPAHTRLDPGDVLGILNSLGKI